MIFWFCLGLSVLMRDREVKSKIKHCYLILIHLVTKKMLLTCKPILIYLLIEISMHI